jgi:Phasin protein
MEFGDDIMTKGVDSIQHAFNVQLNPETTKLPSFGTILQTIVAEGTDYTKKSIDKHTVFAEKLLDAKSLDTMIQIQSEYARSSYTDFAAQGAKMRELYSDLAKACFKPIELTMSNMPSTKQSASFDPRGGSARGALPDQQD